MSRFNLYHNYRNISERDRVRFVLFCSCWTVVFSILYGVLFFTMSTSIFVSVLSHIVLCVTRRLLRMHLLIVS